MSSDESLQISVVIPVYNEEGNLPTLFSRLYPALDELKRSYEIIFTNDGSADRSSEILAAQHAKRPDVTRVIEFNANYGHMPKRSFRFMGGSSIRPANQVPAGRLTHGYHPQKT